MSVVSNVLVAADNEDAESDGGNEHPDTSPAGPGDFIHVGGTTSFSFRSNVELRSMSATHLSPLSALPPSAR